MKRTSVRKSFLATAIAGLTVALVPAHATAGLTAFTADGRALSLGSVVAEAHALAKSAPSTTTA